MILDNPFIIVEIGINHGGNYDTAVKMVDAAMDAGGKVIKFQTHIPDEEMAEEAKTIIPDNADKSIYELIEECALTYEEEEKLKGYIESKGGTFLSTPFSRAAVDRLEELGVEAYKIGSGASLDLVRYVASKAKPVILSTGMAGMGEVWEKVSILDEANVPYAVLQCTNLYPTPPDLVCLGAIEQFKELFPIVGLSDHTTSNHAAFGAIALGANIIERHFTDSKDRKGPDICCSMDPADLRDLIDGMDRLIKSRVGNKTRLMQERTTRKFALYSVAALQDIEEGELLTPDNIGLKRPGIGHFTEMDYQKMLFNHHAKKNIKKGHLLGVDDA